jgi:hypothetical protein
MVARAGRHGDAADGTGNADAERTDANNRACDHDLAGDPRH